MTNQLLIYENAVPISADTHRDISVRTGANWKFAKTLNSVPIVVAEFEPACIEMPIVFAGEGDDIAPVALLGLRAEENLFVSPEGDWIGTYVPAFLRRYPFVFAATGENGETLTLCIDEGFEGLNREGRGERLFDSEGERTRYLENMLQFTSDYQTQHMLTRSFCARLIELDLLEPAVATMKLPDGQSHSLTGFRRVNRAKLAALGADRVAELFGNDSLALIYFHLASLGHMGGLVQRLPEQPSQKPVKKGKKAAKSNATEAET
ncbi:SapC family protein [Maritimibacter sp. HL-12]|uniref:SapC family protein n=1 Tax=Maritimibacter sp. HL-12 TaxID=1162418 RepID=UPI000A0F2749|nr:SapC family protein [Maritimibacter sp. HL-12]SMH41797.1 SapC protein [Maritimibacter sp. HL-12]